MAFATSLAPCEIATKDAERTCRYMKMRSTFWRADLVTSGLDRFSMLDESVSSCSSRSDASAEFVPVVLAEMRRRCLRALSTERLT